MSIYVSLLTAGTNSHQETSENANAFGTDFVSQGVIGAITNTSGVAPSTGAFAVNAQSTPNMTVAVSAGVAYVTGTPASQNSQTLRVRNSASANVTISANSSGSTKYDWVYIKLDATKAANPAVAGDDVATLVTSRSSSSSSDNGTPPTYGYCVAVVTVANGASSITNANITDKRVLATSVPTGSVGSSALATAAVTSTKIDWASTGASAGIWWEEIGRATLSTAGDLISLPSLPSRKYIKIIIRIVNSGALNMILRFNNDSAANYAWRTNTNGSADTTSSGDTGITINSGSYNLSAWCDIINTSSTEKSVFGESIAVNTAGATNIPGRSITSAKWANTSAVISRIDLVNTGAGDFASGSEMVVLGHN